MVWVLKNKFDVILRLPARPQAGAQNDNATQPDKVTAKVRGRKQSAS